MNLNQQAPGSTPQKPQKADAHEQVLELTLDELSYVAGATIFMKIPFKY